MIVSKMSGKLKGIKAVNTSPLDNPFCQAMAQHEDYICSHCYSQRMLKGLRRNCRPAWQANGIELAFAPLVNIPKFILGKTPLVRFSAHGDLFNRQHAENLFKIAEHNPLIHFALWTKRPELIKGQFIPDNVVLVYSTPKINGTPKKPYYFHKVFTAYTKKHATEHNIKINCSGKKCFTCRLCYYRSGDNEVNELLK